MLLACFPSSFGAPRLPPLWNLRLIALVDRCVPLLGRPCVCAFSSCSPAQGFWRCIQGFGYSAVIVNHHLWAACCEMGFASVESMSLPFLPTPTFHNLLRVVSGI